MRSLLTLLGMTTALALASCQTAAVYDSAADPDPQPDEKLVYKTTPQTPLELHIFKPADHKPSDKTPCIVFFHGGGWLKGEPKQFYPHGRYLASRGMVVISAQYRLIKVNGTTAYECIKDAKSAIRWVRSHAGELGIDPNRIAAGGGSAGGQMAASTGTTTGFEEEGENLSINSRPNALVLYNPVYDNGPGAFGHGQIIKDWEKFSPLHNISKDTPPAIVFLGTEDNLIPVATAEKFRDLMRQAGVRSDLCLYEGQSHGFFNHRGNKSPFYYKTVIETDKFLTSLGYLKGKPTMQEIPISAASTSKITTSTDE